LCDYEGEKLPLSQFKGVDEIVEEIKIMYWKWSISRIRGPPCFL